MFPRLLLKERGEELSRGGWEKDAIRRSCWGEKEREKAWRGGGERGRERERKGERERDDTNETSNKSSVPSKSRVPPLYISSPLRVGPQTGQEHTYKLAQ